MITLVSYIITAILILNNHGWWAVVFFVIGTLAIPVGGEE